MAKSGWRKSQYWDWAKDHAAVLEDLFPLHVCEAAAATCRLQLRGLKSHGNQWGKGVVTFMQTNGHRPAHLENDVQVRGKWIELDAHASADLVLGCFGITMDDVYGHFGEPSPGERIDLDLYQIVAAIAPDFTSQTTTAVA